MRFKLKLKPNHSAFGKRLPLNYQYEQSAAIYGIFNRANADFTTWLHENGFRLQSGKSFKLFTFSRFGIEKYRIIKTTSEIEILSDSVEWLISFQPEISTEKFIQGIFANQQFEVGTRKSNVHFQVQNIELMPQPSFTEVMPYHTLSPVCIPLKREDNTVEYISPAHPQAIAMIRLNLLEKYKVIHGTDYPSSDFHFDLRVLNEPKSSLLTIKTGTSEESKVRGFNFNFTFTAPPDLQQILYETGCGSKNSMGFGMVKSV
ncbi:MAG: CRISPR-associated endoribonuclease Cas6 [Paludibacteraceae bacterium]